ncbi:hypothetical protein TGAMA5MH_10158 [Trichoderma gamsii]|uniref:Uncharacterized protein n=1 Tax=Trichoderma gamsii TaxID=398673 RepID=A0A2K0SXQ9_9HYPO|nr:hypothetical protein TGAMA5MH_10158 [Trichoderma gamsii]
MGSAKPGGLPCLRVSGPLERLALRPAIPWFLAPVRRCYREVLGPRRPRSTRRTAVRCATRHQKPHGDKAATPQPASQPNAVPPPPTSLRARPSPPLESRPSCLWAFVGASGRYLTLASPALPPARSLPAEASRSHPPERRDHEALTPRFLRNHRRSLTLPDSDAICEPPACSHCIRSRLSPRL